MGPIRRNRMVYGIAYPMLFSIPSWRMAGSRQASWQPWQLDSHVELGR